MAVTDVRLDVGRCPCQNCVRTGRCVSSVSVSQCHCHGVSNSADSYTSLLQRCVGSVSSPPATTPACTALYCHLLDYNKTLVTVQLSLSLQEGGKKAVCDFALGGTSALLGLYSQSLSRSSGEGRVGRGSLNISPDIDSHGTSKNRELRALKWEQLHCISLMQVYIAADIIKLALRRTTRVQLSYPTSALC